MRNSGEVELYTGTTLEIRSGATLTTNTFIILDIAKEGDTAFVPGTDPVPDLVTVIVGGTITSGIDASGYSGREHITIKQGGIVGGDIELGGGTDTLVIETINPSH